MPVNQFSIPWRITWLVGLCLLAIVVVLTLLSLQRMSDNNAQIQARNTRMLEAEAHQRLLAEGRLQGLNLQRYLLAAYQEGLGLQRYTLQLRRIASEQQSPPQQLRQALNRLVKSNLQANPQLLSLYLIFEPDALDGSGDAFAGQSTLGSNEQGRFAAYWAQRDGQISSMAVSDGGQALQWLSRGEEHVAAKDNQLRVLSPVRPVPESAPWAVLLSVPHVTVLKPALELQGDLGTRNTRCSGQIEGHCHWQR